MWFCWVLCSVLILKIVVMEWFYCFAGGLLFVICDTF